MVADGASRGGTLLSASRPTRWGCPMTDKPEGESGLWFFEERADPAYDVDAQLSDSEETQRMPAVADAPPRTEQPVADARQQTPQVEPTPPVAAQQPDAAQPPAQQAPAQQAPAQQAPAQQAPPPRPPAQPAGQRPAPAAPMQPQSAQATMPRLVSPSFAVVRRGGYDKAAVDSFVAQQQHEATLSAAQFRSTAREVARLQALVGDLEKRLAEMGTPTYAGLGDHAAAMLRIAEEQASNVTVQAQQAADESRTRVEREAAALLADAEKEAADIRATTLQEIEQRRQTVLAEAEADRTLAASEATDILAAANREADQVKIAARQEATTLVQSAKREAEQTRAAADRETAEARRILAVERERLTKEATDRHSTAAAETARLVEEAETRANAADERTREAIATATRHREQTMAASDESLTRARREAEQLVSAARKQAEQIVANAGSDADRQLAAARTQLSLLQKRRDGIVAQLSQLRDLVASFGQPDEVLNPEGGSGSSGTPSGA
jgi:hypothetical protein